MKTTKKKPKTMWDLGFRYFCPKCRMAFKENLVFNWGNFGCVDVAIVNAVHDGEYIQILLAEAAPSGNQKFTEWLENRLKDRFMIDIPIHIIMEW